jgi:hypothetical protein
VCSDDGLCGHIGKCPRGYRRTLPSEPLLRHLTRSQRRRLRFVTTKCLPHGGEQEAQDILWIIDPYAGINRHFEIDNRMHTRPLTAPPDRVLKGHRRKADLRVLVTEIVVTPWASSTTFAEIEQIVKDGGYSIPVRPSALTRFRKFLPSDS